jgi:SP family general alpha glucoside:H+ symporter-like MFS transporter
MLCLLWCWFRLPETKDRSFGEIDTLFENKVPARKFKYTKVDQFALDREAHSPTLEDKKLEADHVENV